MGWWNSLSRNQRWMLVVSALGFAIAQIDQPFPRVTVLHNAPTLLFLIAFPWLAQRFKLSDASWLCVFGFLALHTIGGRYTYTNTPYDVWFEALIGQGLNPLMGWERNHYDRFVHLAFGLLTVGPVAELLQKHMRVTRGLAIYIGVEFVMGLSALYEIFEWLLSVFLAARDIEAYNGQQGDVWDPQKDMALAFAGALATALALWLRRANKESSVEDKGNTL